MYIMLGTRPDIAHAVGILSRFSSNPSPDHIRAVNRTFGYLSNTQGTALCYRKTDSPKPIYGYTDADWGGERETGRSTSGYVFFLSSAAISWSSKKQGVTATSTTEAEYIALFHGTLNAVWIGYPPEKAIDILCDNKAAVDIANGGDLPHDRTKHINVKYNRVRDHVASNEISVTQVKSEKNLADQFTKVLPRDRFNNLSDALGFEPLDQLS